MGIGIGGAEGGPIVAERQIERCWLVVVTVSVAGKLCAHQCARQQMQRGIPVKCSW